MQIPASILARVWPRFQGQGRVKQHPFPEASGPGVDLYGTIGGGYVLRADGVLFEWGWEFEGLRALDLRGGYRALVVCKEQNPELGEALPIRPSDASDCPKCHGRGHLDFGALRDLLLCDRCDGLGWSAA